MHIQRRRALLTLAAVGRSPPQSFMDSPVRY
jgi:hypothetical protein